MEVWRPIPSLPQYIASSLGRVMRVPHLAPMPHGGLRPYGGKPIKGVWVEADQRYILNVDGHTKKVHRLVCEAFNGAPPAPGLDCEHIDENPRNNVPDNLRWATRKENLNRPRLKAYHRKVCRQKMARQSGAAVSKAKAAA